MPAGAPVEVIEGPAREPWARGLTATVPVIEHADDRFVAGVTWGPTTCEDVVSYDPCAAGTLAVTGSRPGIRSFEPLVLVGRDFCSPMQWKAENGEERAREHLKMGGSAAIEAHLWTGTGTSLAEPGTTVLGTGAQTPAMGLALLVQAIADGNGGIGYIHARPKLVEIWSSIGALIHNTADGTITTASGIPVVAGSGYPGTGPNGEAVTLTSEWAYATDAMAVHVGAPVLVPDNISQATNKSTNFTGWQAEMGAIAVWGGCVTVTVQIDPTSAGAGASLPTGASTAAKQDTGNTSLGTIAGNTNGETLTSYITRVTTATTTTIPGTRRSFSILVVAAASTASPTFLGVALPVGFAGSWSADVPTDTLTGGSLVTVAGDDVIVTQVG